MNRFGAGPLSRAQNGRDIQITLIRRGGTNRVGFVRHAHVQSVRIGFRENRHRRDSQIATSANHARSDLTPVGN